MMAYVASPGIGDWARLATSSDVMATGPIVMSLDEPNNVYMKTPMKDEYKPYCTHIVGS